MRLLRIASLMLAVVAFTGCDDDPAGPDSSAGAYALISVNGENVPATVVELVDYTLELVSGSITINSAGTFSATHTIRETESGETATFTETCSGTWTQSGSTLTFAEAADVNTDCGADYSATLAGNTLTVSYESQIQAVYRK